jgi:Na+-driven multidrug efflux pump
VISLCRQLVVLIPAAYLLSLSRNVDLVWWSFPIAELISLLMTIVFFRRVYHSTFENFKENDAKEAV